MLLRRFVQPLVLLSFTAVALAAPQEPRRLAFVDVSVVPMNSEQVVAGQTVLVEGERIVSIGPVGSVALPADVTRIDVRGKYLMPGLADLHIHIPPEGSDEVTAAKEFLLFVAHGVTTARVMIGQPEHLALRDKIARGELLGPSLYVAGPPLGIQAGALPGVPEIKTLDDARRVPAEQKQAGYDCVKILDDLTLEQYDAIFAGAREAGIPVVGHVPDSVSLEHVLAMKQDSIEHLAGYVEALIPAAIRSKPDFRLRDILGVLEEARIPELAVATKRAGIPNVPTLYFWSALVNADSPEELAKRPGIEFVTRKEQNAWAEQRRKAIARNPSPPDYAHFHEVRARITKALADAGATILLGTDSPDFYNVAGVAVHEELSRLVAAGLTPYQALRGGTRAAAEFVHAEREFGTVAPGLRADLLLLDANPLSDVRNLRRRAGVMVRGRWLPEAELRQSLAALAAEAAAGA